MNSIQLTEEHKSKLLEMCNKLFKDIPNFHSVSLCDQRQNHGIHCSNESKIFIAVSVQDGLIYPINYIHWFEFCINELCFKILNTKRNYLGLSELQKFRLQEYSKKHPVDYLYDEFKKLNNG